VQGEVYETISKHYTEFQHHLSLERTLDKEVDWLVAEIDGIQAQMLNGTVISLSLSLALVCRKSTMGVLFKDADPTYCMGSCPT
jgi:hypothetical protein